MAPKGGAKKNRSWTPPSDGPGTYRKHRNDQDHNGIKKPPSAKKEGDFGPGYLGVKAGHPTKNRGVNRQQKKSEEQADTYDFRGPSPI